MVSWDDGRLLDTHEVGLIALIRATVPRPKDRQRIEDECAYAEYLRRKIAYRVEVNENGCWVWQGGLNHKGYGVLGAYRKKSVYAHRVSYKVFFDEDPIPRGWSLDHLCRNRACVNFEHLEAVPHGENVRRGNTGITWRSRTHCSNGHPFDEVNTYSRGDGGRGCRQCRRDRTKRFRENNIEVVRERDRLAKRRKSLEKREAR